MPISIMDAVVKAITFQILGHVAASKLQGWIHPEGPATRAIAGATAHGEMNVPGAQSWKVLQLETTVGWDIGKPSISELLTIVKQF